MQEMVLGVVGTFKDHRSLALTLQDSEHIARKLGLLIMTLIFFILIVSATPVNAPLRYSSLQGQLKSLVVGAMEGGRQAAILNILQRGRGRWQALVG